MLRIHPRYSAKETKDYYENALATSDYYSEKGEIIGQWRGQTAEQIGLSGNVSQDEFNNLCDNINPIDGEKLTARTNAKRRVAYDFTFSAPKSVSLAYAVNEDLRILEAFKESYLDTMKLVEEATQTRVRVAGKNENRTTGNILYSDYIHSTTRPLEDGTPDPHLHGHLVVMNVTHDKFEDKFKAIEIGDIKQNGSFFEAHFNNNFAERLSKSGYVIERTKKSFRLAGVSKETEKRFSRRTTQVEKKAAEVEAKLKNQLGYDAKLSDKVKSDLGAKTRRTKSKDYSFTQLKDIWKSRLSDDEKLGLLPSNNSGGLKEKLTAKEAIDLSLKHHLERKSAAEEKEILTYAFQQSAGSVGSKQIRNELTKRRDLKSKKNKEGTFYTTQKAIDEEKFLIDISRKNRGKYAPINGRYKIENEEMSKEQKAAVRHALKSKDLVTVIAGGAGTGKTWSVKEIANGARKAGRRFHAFAPSSGASRGVQVQEGFKNATTIAQLIENNSLQRNVKDGIIWIDEAGMVGNKTMGRILNIAKQQNARVLLTGDVKQHNSVERGDALRIMQEKAGIRAANIKTIRRQKPQNYKQAINFLSSGEIEKGFQVLDQFGAIRESKDQASTFEAASREYLASRRAKQETMIVATTHRQGKAVTEYIRNELKEQKVLSGKAQQFSTNETAAFTEAQKQDHTNYEAGQIVTFHKSGKGGFIKGRDYKVDEVKDAKVMVTDKHGVQRILGLKDVERFTVFNQKQTELLKGDLIRITKNQTSKNEKRLDNGDLLTIDGFTKDGDIKATRGKTNIILDKDQGHFTHGYYTTSPASQGKSINKVIVVQTAASGRAANKEQFYVSASRGKFEISVHTDDKRNMLRNVQRSSTRMTALEVAQRSIKDRMKQKIEALKQITRTKISKLRDGFYKRDLSSIIRKPVTTTKTAKHVIKGR